MRTWIGVITIVLLLAVAVGNAWGFVQYTVTDVGTLGGKNSYAYDINAIGQVVGSALTTEGRRHAFLYSGGEMTDLGSLGGHGSEACAINGKGQIVGQSENSSGTYVPFIWQDGVGMRALGSMGDTRGRALDINNSGQVVGACQMANGEERAFLWQEGSPMRDLGALGGLYSSASGINNSGQIVGRAYTSTDASGAHHAFLWQGGTGMQDLGTLGGSMGGASAINDSGRVVGCDLASDGKYHAFIWQSNTGMQDFGLFGDSLIYINDINNSGQVVGTYYTSTITTGHAFFWQSSTGMQDLNNTIYPSGQLTTSSAFGINDVGQIVGWATYPNGDQRAFLLTPVPEPSTFVLLGMGAVGLLACAWRRRERTAAFAQGQHVWTTCRNQLFALPLCITMAAMVLWADGTVGASADGALILETSRPGPAPSGSFGTALYPQQAMGARFTVDTPVAITAIGGHLRGFGGTLFGAIVSLNGPNALPSGSPLEPSSVLAYTVFEPPSSSSHMSIPLSVTVEPGTYGLVFGSGQFGATGSGILVNNNIPVPAQSSLFGWWELYATRWVWSNMSTSSYNASRFVVEGNAVPEPSTFVLVGMGAVGLLACAWRRRRRAA